MIMGEKNAIFTRISLVLLRIRACEVTGRICLGQLIYENTVFFLFYLFACKLPSLFTVQCSLGSDITYLEMSSFPSLTSIPFFHVKPFQL